MEGVEEGKKGGSRKERKLLDFLYVLTRPKIGGYLGPYFSEKHTFQNRSGCGLDTLPPCWFHLSSALCRSFRQHR